jgi:predicted  nucleic acid-binding Zn-ribbon protein
VSAEEPLSARERSARGAPEAGDLRRLLDLQALDLAIDRLRSRLAELESQEDLRQARARVAETDARLAELQLSIDAVAREQRRLESDVDSVEQKIEAERKREFDGSVANPKELQSIEHEVQNLRARKSRMEDDVIEKMEQRELLEAQLPPVQAEATEARQRLAEIERTSAKELVEVERDLADRSAERAALAGHFDEELLELYEDLRRQKKGVAVVELEDGVCGGCHQKLSPMYLDQLKRTEGIRRCEYCRRILVFD